MKRPSTLVTLATVPLLLLALPAGAGTGSAVRAKPVHARTLLVEKGPIHAFAQDAGAIAWIDSRYKVHVRRLSTRTGSIVGSASTRGPSNRPLALAGTRALWTSYSGINEPETILQTGPPGADVGTLDILGGLAGDGATLVYGWVSEYTGLCGCEPIVTAVSGGVQVVSGQHSLPPIPNVPPPVKVALSQGRLAVVPAASPPYPLDGYTPRAAEDGPVNVYDLSGRLLSSAYGVAPSGYVVGTVRAIALAWPKLAVLVERPDGNKWIERFDARTGKPIVVVENGNHLSAWTRVPLAATGLATGSVGTIFRVGRTIYLLSNRNEPKLVGRAAGTPIGLSIEGKRIAWAENVKGHGRIVALTLR